MQRDLESLQAGHAALLATLPASTGAAAPPDARATYDRLRAQQRDWEDRMSALLDTVSALQSPSQRVPSTAGGQSVRFTPAAR